MQTADQSQRAHSNERKTKNRYRHRYRFTTESRHAKHPGALPGAGKLPGELPGGGGPSGPPFDAPAPFERNQPHTNPRFPHHPDTFAARTLPRHFRFDFLKLEEPFTEGDLERALVRHMNTTLQTLGRGFAFLGRQVVLSHNHRRHRVDLLFYHVALRRHIIVELKRGPFTPEFAGKINLYCHLADQLLREPDDPPTLGLILCQTADHDLVTGATTAIARDIRVATYSL